MEGAQSEPFYRVSPLLQSWALSQVAGTTVFLKCENVQPSGSFKIRGIGHFCQEVRPAACDAARAGTASADEPQLRPSLPRWPGRGTDTSCAPQVTPFLLPGVLWAGVGAGIRCAGLGLLFKGQPVKVTASIATVHILLLQSKMSGGSR